MSTPAPTPARTPLLCQRFVGVFLLQGTTALPVRSLLVNWGAGFQKTGISWLAEDELTASLEEGGQGYRAVQHIASQLRLRLTVTSASTGLVSASLEQVKDGLLLLEHGRHANASVAALRALGAATHAWGLRAPP
ncbi:hypothetical protein [Deinococcus multiflagellatus]|uniref:Uncharacterized protein n=1 Tax=Deinococcus multiflagellatus TaxID=1656887 RepID=A0ABW1ZQJ8_9DEIO|nr:hypothetical protein [Deinococcus multiflagellatus]MBZ9715315.1 hypothetical protein [Deinococcus multiflagellatus]